MNSLQQALAQFQKENRFYGKGPLCVALIITQHARVGLPLHEDQLLTENQGQVKGLGKDAVQAVLKRHAITRILAAEGGRTSRGSIGNMRKYVPFLNELHANGALDLEAVEAFWIARVREFFNAKPFSLRKDDSLSLRKLVRDVIEQARQRQREAAGMQYTGAVLQHLVGAKLDCALGEGLFEHNSFSTSDAQSGRAGDFFISGNTAIHVTASPGEAVIGRCQKNLDDGHRPIIVTTTRGVTVAEELARNEGLDDRIDVFEVEQFVALNLHELGKFTPSGRRNAVVEIVKRYNEIVEQFETDPSLKIEIRS